MKKKKIFSDRLKKARESKGFTQENIAVKLGISRGGYSRIETGRVEITTKNLVKIAEILEISIDWLLFGKKVDVDQIRQGIFSDFGKNAGAVEILFNGIKGQENEILLHAILSFYFEKKGQEKSKIFYQVESGK